MKNILTFMLLAALFLSACTEKDKEPVLSPGAAPSITSPAGGTSFVLTEATADNVFSAFTWTAAEYGYPAGVNYTLELDTAGNNFAAAETVGSVNALNLGDITQKKINTILLAKNFPFDVDASVEFRVIAKLGSDPTLPVLTSQTVTVTIRPYEPSFPHLQVPGNYQGWDATNENTVIFSPTDNKKYEGYINFSIPNAEYKYTNGNSFDVNYGDNGNDGSLEPGGANIPLVDAGVYRLNVDLKALTHSHTKTDWGIIGSATAGGWDSDQDLTYDPVTNTLKITLDLLVGEIKFRANDDWAINFGDTGANKELDYGGDNIAIPEAGNYNIELNLGVAVYTYKITKN